MDVAYIQLVVHFDVSFHTISSSYRRRWAYISRRNYHKRTKFLPNLLFLFVSMMMVCRTFDTQSMKIIKYYFSEMWKNWSFKNNCEKHFAGKVV
jgi:hypothetical protein